MTTATPAKLALVLATYAPWIHHGHRIRLISHPHAPQNVVVTPGVRALTLSTFGAKTNRVATPGRLDMVLTTFTPGPLATQVITPSTLALILTMKRVQVNGIQLEGASLVLTGLEPAINPRFITNATKVLTMYAPIIKHELNVQPQFLFLETFAPDAFEALVPITKALVLTKFAPAVLTPRLVTPGVLAHTSATFAPTVTSSG